jgi:hypothetical protein
MAIQELSEGAYFVIDGFSYQTRIQKYDPLATNQTLLSFGDDVLGGIAVLEIEPADDRDDFMGELLKTPVVIDEPDEHEEAKAREELKRITPPHAELLKLADRFPAPQEWYDE